MTDIIKFDEAEHKYYINGEEAISATTLMKKYELSADYGGISKDVLAKAAAKGNAIHKALELHIGGVPNPGLFDEVKLFDDYMSKRKIALSDCESEQIVYDKDYMIAGTLDLMYPTDTSTIIADFKTTSTLHIDAVAWQLSIYNYLVTRGNVIKYYFNKLQVFHFKQGRLYVKDVYTVDFDAVKGLFEAYKAGADTYEYTKPNNIVSNTEEKLIEQLATEIKTVKEHLNTLQEEQKILLAKVESNFEKAKEYSYKTPTLSLAYIPPRQQVKLVKKKVEDFIIQHGGDLKDFQTTITRKASVRCTLRNPSATDADKDTK